jgi:hypothetical protein
MANILYLVGIAGIIILMAVALKPKLFWPLLIFVAVGTAGLMVQGYCLIDEYFIMCVLLGALLVISISGIQLQKKQGDIWVQLHRLTFFLMIIYMFVQSVRGVFLWEDWRIIRWVGYYIMLGITAFIISKKGFPIPSIRNISLSVASSTLLYFSFYLTHGLYYEKFKGISRFAMQSIEWSGSSYSTFPLVVAMPVVIFLIRYGTRIEKYFGWFVLGIASVMGYYYLSRISAIIIITFLIAQVLTLRVRKTTFLIFLLILVFICVYLVQDNKWEPIEKTVNYFGSLVESAQFLFLPRISDVGRYVHTKVAFIAIKENLKTLLFGYGVHSSHYVLGPYLRELFSQCQPNVEVKAIVRTTGFTALFVETGIIGIMLLVLNFIFIVYEVLKLKHNPNRIFLLLAVFFTFIWLFVSNIQDIMLFYLLIMPSGLFIQLNKYGLNSQFLKKVN